MKCRVTLLLLCLLVGSTGSAFAQTTLPGIGPFLTISVANYQMAATDPQGEMLRYYGKRFNAGFRVYNFDNQHFHEQLNGRLAAGDIPDFLYLRTATNLETYARSGVLAPIPLDTLSRQAPRLVNVLRKYAPQYLDMGKVDGVLYGLPVVSDTNAFHIPLVYRADWLKRLGFASPPTTLSEFERYVYACAQNDPDGNGKKDTYGLSRDGLVAVFGAFGLVAFDDKTDYWLLEDGVVKNAAIASQAKAALAILARWYRDGVIDPEFITGENRGGYWALSQAFLSGRIGFTTHGNYYHWVVPGAYYERDASGHSLPTEGFANGKELSRWQPGASLAFGQALSGPTGKRGIKEFNRLMNFVTIGRPAASVPGKLERILRILDESASSDPRERLTMRYGLEGKHWKLLDPQSEAMVVLPPWDKDEAYWSRIGCELWMEVPLPSRAPREQWARSLGYDQYGLESLVQVGLPLMMKYDSVLRNLRIEAYIAIITGAKPLGYFDEFVRNYLAAGGAVVQQEINRYHANRR